MNWQTSSQKSKFGFCVKEASILKGVSSKSTRLSKNWQLHQRLCFILKIWNGAHQHYKASLDSSGLHLSVGQLLHLVLHLHALQPQDPRLHSCLSGLIPYKLRVSRLVDSKCPRAQFHCWAWFVEVAKGVFVILITNSFHKYSVGRIYWSVSCLNSTTCKCNCTLFHLIQNN